MEFLHDLNTIITTESIEIDRRVTMKKSSVIDWVALVLVIIGAINWGLIGLAHFNLVEYVFGGQATSSAARVRALSTGFAVVCEK